MNIIITNTSPSLSTAGSKVKSLECVYMIPDRVLIRNKLALVTLHLRAQCLHDSRTKVKPFRIEFEFVHVPDRNFQSSARSYPGII